MIYTDDTFIDTDTAQTSITLHKICLSYALDIPEVRGGKSQKRFWQPDDWA